VFYISGVDRSGLKSLWSPSVRWTEVTEGFAGGEVIPQSYNGSPDSLDTLRNNVLKSGQVGRLVANDFKSSIVDIRCWSPTRTRRTRASCWRWTTASSPMS
jgi:predicted RND superfamily exporter protein